MGTLSTIVYVIGMALAAGSWAMGMRSYNRLGARANLSFWQRWYSFEVYEYALGPAAGTLDARRMWLGFGLMFVFLFAGGMLAGALAPHAGG